MIHRASSCHAHRGDVRIRDLEPSFGNLPLGDPVAAGRSCWIGQAMVGGPLTLKPMDEMAAIEHIQLLLPGAPAGEVWIGDDAAVVSPSAGPLLLATDLTVVGVHADLELVALDDLGWKALAVNVSDLAAMGGRPERALVSVAVPAGTDIDLLYSGLAEAARDYACPVVGGDLANADTLVVSVAVTGKVPGGRAVLRSGASAGDILWVTGPLGASAAGLSYLRAARAKAVDEVTEAGPAVAAAIVAHRRPRARVAEGQAAAAAGATAMIDVSDGLGLDLNRLAVASGVGVALDEVPVADGATMDDALGGGEDYELVFAAPDVQAVADAFATAGLRTPIRIGVCTAEPSERRVKGGPLLVTGWQHRFD